MFILSALNPIHRTSQLDRLLKLAHQRIKDEQAVTLSRVQQEGYTTVKLCEDQTKQILFVNVVTQDLSPDKAGDLSDELRALTQDDRYTKFKKVILNFSNVRFMNNKALSGIIALHNHLQEQGGRLQIYGINDQIKNVLEITRFDQFLNISANEQEAINTCIPQK